MLVVEQPARPRHEVATGRVETSAACAERWSTGVDSLVDQ